MKKQNFLFGLLFIVFFSMAFSSCKSSRGTSGSSAATNSTADAPVITDSDRENVLLIDMLRRVPGLNITGGNYNPQITIRGTKSIMGDNNPLFVLDGVPLGRNYADAAANVNTINIASIKVLKGTKAAIYGARGSMGVIEILTKKN